MDVMSYLGVSVDCVGHPTAGLDLVGVQTPKLELFLEQGAAHMRRVMEFARAIIVQDLCEHPRVPVEEVLVEDGVVVGEGLRQPRQPRGRDLLQSGLVGLEADAAHVQGDPVLPVHGGRDA